MSSAWGDSWGSSWGDSWGEAAPPAPATVGPRSLLAPWVGGAGAVPAVVVPATVGYTSLLAFWLGGAAVPAESPAPAPSPMPPGVGHGKAARRAHDDELDQALHRRLMEDDETLLLAIAALVASRRLH